jgi:hypothetical protein
MMLAVLSPSPAGRGESMVHQNQRDILLALLKFPTTLL